MSKLKALLFKPKWQHKDAAIRADAVGKQEDPELQQSLPEIARNDPSPEVRLQAVKRLDDIYHLIRAATDDDDPRIREHAWRGYRAMLAGEHPHAPPMDIRLEIIPRLDDAEMIEYLAVHGREEAIREAALAKVGKQGLLGDIALGDASPRLRRQAAGRLEQRSTLERVAQGSRRHDKTVHRLVNDKLAGLDSAGASEAADVSAMALCTAIEQLSRSDYLKEERARRLADIEQRWEALPEPARADHHQRFDGARRIVLRTLEGTATGDSQEPPELRALRLELEGALGDAAQADEGHPLRRLDPLIERLRKLCEPVRQQLAEEDHQQLDAAIQRLTAVRERVLETQPVDSRLKALMDEVAAVKPRAADARKLGRLQEQWDKAWSRLSHPATNDHSLAERFRATIAKLEQAVASRAQAREQALERIEDEVSALEQALEEGHLDRAAKAQGRVLGTLKLIGPHPQVDRTDFKARLQTARGKLHELRDWQHWANNKIREQLCAEAEALPGGLHPDAVSEKIKALRAQWRELNESEKLPGDNPKKMPAAALYRRFQTACNKGFEPAKEFFEKRDEVRQHHLEDLEKLAREIEAAVAEGGSDDFRKLERLVRDGRRSLRELVNVPPRARGPMSRRLREGANTLDQRLEEHYRIIERRKQRLIDEVSALDPQADLNAAIAAAKDAQQRWRDAGRTRRDREQKLWKSFRAASDRIFEHLSAVREEEKAEERARYEQLDALLAEAETLLTRDASLLDSVAQDLHRLQDRWRQVGVVHRKREDRFQSLCRQIEGLQRAAEAERTLAGKRAQRELSALCRRAEARWFGAKADDLDEIRNRAEALLDQHEMPEGLRKRWKAAISGSDAPSDAVVQSQVEAAQGICIALEFLAGAQTPAEFQQQRMDYQVHRLSRRMAGERSQRLEDEVEELEQQWYACGPLPPAEAESLGKRFHQAVDLLDRNLHQEAAGSH